MFAGATVQQLQAIKGGHKRLHGRGALRLPRLAATGSSRKRSQNRVPLLPRRASLPEAPPTKLPEAPPRAALSGRCNLHAQGENSIAAHLPSVIQTFLKWAIEAHKRCASCYERAQHEATVNRIFNLEIEDVNDSFRLTPTEVALVTTPKIYKQQQSQPISVDVFELEAEQAFEAAFALFCFSRICTVSKTKSNGHGRTATTVKRGIIILAESITKGLDRMAPYPDVDVTSFDDFIFLPTARTLLKFVMIANVESNGCSMQGPPPIMPLRFNYINQPGKADMPEHKELQRDNQILSQLLIDLMLPDKARKHARNLGDEEMLKRPQKDIVLRMLSKVWKSGKLSVTAAVTSRVLLNVLNTCRTAPRFNRQLTYACQHASKGFEFSQVPGGGLKTRGLNWPFSGNQVLAGTWDLLSSIETPVSRDEGPNAANAGRMGQRRAAAFERVNLGLTQPVPANDFVLTHNLLYSGSAMLRLLLEYQEARLSLANHHDGIFAAAQIYNALRQHKMLDRPWPIKYRIIELYRRVLFAEAIPTRTEDIVKRFTYRLDPTQKRFFEDEKFKLREPVSFQPLRSLLDSARPVQHRKQQMTPEQFMGNAQEADSEALDDLSIDYVRLTWRYLMLNDKLRRMRKVELEVEGMDLRFEPGSMNNDSALLIMCREAVDEEENSGGGGIMYPLGAAPPSSPDRREEKSLQGGGAVDDNANAPALSLASIPLVIHHASAAAKLGALLASTTYTIVTFCTGYDGTHGHMSPRLASLVARYCKEDENGSKAKELAPATRQKQKQQGQGQGPRWLGEKVCQEASGPRPRSWAASAKKRGRATTAAETAGLTGRVILAD
ncbi:hypothetical protein DL764_005461 [Monosporascus ibericus]|uniref:Uncharacterized protein n=1 Tax=Monosporascus ibericus TaxID=155417 RepID=A0A4Q4T8W2_9PEZI|nr:hypothetical protein DL764_005461 [Monosporascus ibericus]